jgi:hypothetical protein
MERVRPTDKDVTKAKDRRLLPQMSEKTSKTIDDAGIA